MEKHTDNFEEIKNVPSEAKVGRNMFVLSGPSGSGKDTVFSLVKKRKPDVERVTTHTTRSPRSNEINGVDYFFVTEEEFFNLSAENAFVEENRYVKDCYGTTFAEVERHDKSKPLFLIIDVNGMKNIRKVYDIKSIFIMPPSLDELRKRIISRGENTPEQVEKRMQQALKEIEKACEFDYIVVNDDAERCAEEIIEIIKFAVIATATTR